MFQRISSKWIIVNSICNLCILFSDGELNVLDDILTDAPDQDDELYNPDSEQDKNEKKGTWLYYSDILLKSRQQNFTVQDD